MRVEVQVTSTPTTEENGAISTPLRGIILLQDEPHTAKSFFQSVLTKPFRPWNEMEESISEFLPEWSPCQRSCLIMNVIRFLELNVLMDDYSASKLLAPTQLVAHAWHVLILETELYRDVTIAIQDFHGRRRRMIHHALLRRSEKQEYDARLERTQRLFVSYYGSKMPTELKEFDQSGRKKKHDISKLRQFDSSFSISRAGDSCRAENPWKIRTTVDQNYSDDRRYIRWLPACGCFPLNMRRGYSSKDDVYSSDELLTVNEEVSLLTTPESQPGK